MSVSFLLTDRVGVCLKIVCDVISGNKIAELVARAHVLIVCQNVDPI